VLVTDAELKARIHNAVADTLEGWGLIEFLPPAEWQQLDGEQKRLALDTFYEIQATLKRHAELVLAGHHTVMTP
jgi:hypothetical protein